MISVICGVDVSSTFLDACIGRSGPTGRFANNAAGIASLHEFCRMNQVEMVAMEATGGYEQKAVVHLSDQEMFVAVLNPCSVRQFAKSMGRLEKSDAIDARMIAWYAEIKQPNPVTLAPQAQRHLRAMVTRLRQLTDVRTSQLNQQRLITDPLVQGTFAQMLGLLAKQIEMLEQNIAALIDEDPLWNTVNLAMRSIKGVADRTVARLMADLPELGTLSNKTISKLAGLAPIMADSGKHKGKRVVQGGRSSIREILFVVASVVGRYEPDFIAFQQRLRDAGKPPKVVRIAVAHKLLVRLNAKARDARAQMKVASQKQTAPKTVAA